MALSPMMQHYFSVKEKYKDCIIFYRLGDFYEMFFDDAKTASQVLDLTLTGRDCGLEERAPMCGVPYHSADAYIAKLVAAGYKVAICEQLEDPATAKGMVARDVIRVITAGTITNENFLDARSNNFICCAYKEGEVCAAAWAATSAPPAASCAAKRRQGREGNETGGQDRHGRLPLRKSG